MKKVFILFLFLQTFLFPSYSQHLGPCGTTDGKVKWLEDYQKGLIDAPEFLDTIYVPISIHIVGTNGGSGYFPVPKVLDAFCRLNNDFKASGIQFFIEGDFHYHNNSIWYDHNFQQGGQMMQQTKVQNTINCYFVDSPAGNCGYSSYNLGIALAKSCSDVDASTWAHEVGHFLSLPHPFYGWEGTEPIFNQPAPFQIDDSIVERVDSVDCDIAGDGFCDTPPDYLSYRWTCNSNGFSSFQQTDPNGETFFSDGTLYMSYSNDGCANRFSDGQMAAMRANLLTEKESYLYDQTPKSPITATELVPVMPAEGEFVANYENVLFEWEPVPNATGYLLKVSPYAAITGIVYQYFVNGTSFESTDLKKNKTYYWQLRPFNGQHTCEVETDIASFQTGNVSAVNAIAGLDGLDVFPNPATLGSDLKIIISASTSMDLTASLLTVAGQKVVGATWPLQTGSNQFDLSTEGLQPGMYFLQLTSEKGVASRKVVISAR